MRRSLNPLEIEALRDRTLHLGVQAVAADAEVSEHSVRRALRGERLNCGTARSLAVLLRAWEGACMAA